MNDCKPYQAQLNDLLDGCLEGTQRQSIEKHLEGCEVCRQHYGELKTLVRLLGDVPDSKAPSGFLEGVVNGLAEGRTAQSNEKVASDKVDGATFTILKTSRVWLAAAVMVVAITGLIATSEFGDREGSEETQSVAVLDSSSESPTRRPETVAEGLVESSTADSTVDDETLSQETYKAGPEDALVPKDKAPSTHFEAEHLAEKNAGGSRSRDPQEDDGGRAFVESDLRDMVAKSEGKKEGVSAPGAPAREFQESTRTTRMESASEREASDDEFDLVVEIELPEDFVPGDEAAFSVLRRRLLGSPTTETASEPESVEALRSQELQNQTKNREDLVRDEALEDAEDASRASGSLALDSKAAGEDFFEDRTITEADLIQYLNQVRDKGCAVALVSLGGEGDSGLSKSLFDDTWQAGRPDARAGDSRKSRGRLQKKPNEGSAKGVSSPRSKSPGGPASPGPAVPGAKRGGRGASGSGEGAPGSRPRTGSAPGGVKSSAVTAEESNVRDQSRDKSEADDAGGTKKEVTPRARGGFPPAGGGGGEVLRERRQLQRVQRNKAEPPAEEEPSLRVRFIYKRATKSSGEEGSGD